MLVKFRVSLGSIDAAKFKLDNAKCKEGMQCEVEQSAARWLIAKGIATEVRDEEVKGVAQSPAIKGVKSEGTANK
jgi:hypothetical protein